MALIDFKNIIKIVLSLFISILCNSLIAQESKLPSTINLDIGTNAFVIDNNDFGVFFGVGFEYFIAKPFSVEITGQTGWNSQRLEEAIYPENYLNVDDYVLVTEVNYYSLGVYPRFYQELSDVLYFFADFGIGIESSKSNSTFGNEVSLEEQYLGSASSSGKIYPGAHVGIRIIGKDIHGSFFVGWEQIDLGRSLNKLDIGQTGVFENYSKKTNFLQLGFKLAVPLR